MLSRYALVIASGVVASALLVGCAEGDPDGVIVDGTPPGVSVDTGDGVGSEEEVVAERQLYGNELPEKSLVLTYDDGPGERTSELADYLAAQGIPATFFINGKMVPGRQSSIDRILSRGHTLANHTHDHVHLPRVSAAEMVSQVAQTYAFIVAAQPQGPFLLRAPYGDWKGVVARNLNASPMRKYVGSVFWDVGGVLTAEHGSDHACWNKGVPVERCGQLYMNEIRKKQRGLVLLHDIHNRTVDMTKMLVPILKAEGYRFVPITTVPSIKRALGNVDNPPPPSGACSSATLGRSVPENECVQARSDQRWYRCESGEWMGSSPTDARCTARFPL